jgi:plastocyanin
MSSSQRFVPAALDVVVGEKVTFANDSKEAHTVTAYEEDLPEGVAFFASGGAQDEQAARDDLGPGLIDPGETFEVTFDQPGTYRYFCIPHESVGMAGTIVVTEP